LITEASPDQKLKGLKNQGKQRSAASYNMPGTGSIINDNFNPVEELRKSILLKASNSYSMGAGNNSSNKNLNKNGDNNNNAKFNTSKGKNQLRERSITSGHR
jgi:hypothetical protein